MASPNPANVYGKVQLTYDAKLNAILERAARDIRARVGRLPVGVGGQVRAAQLNLVLNEIRNIQQAMWVSGIGPTIHAGTKDAAKAAENAVEALERVVYTSLPESVAQAVSGGLRATAMSGIERDHARVPRDLSARVYHDFALTSGQVEKTIRSGIIAGLSARELAQDVYTFISPTVPGGASYAAMRLARTEINNSFHEQQKAGGQRPGVNAVKWNLSGSHGKPDLCNVYASQNTDKLGAGLYDPGNVPDKPHPQCLCYLTYDMMSGAEFAAGIKSGKFDKELDARIQANLARIGQPVTPEAKAIAKTPKVTPPKPTPVVRSLSGFRNTKDINKISGVDGARVQKALEFQAKITPRSMDELQVVKYMTKAQERDLGSETLAAYDRIDKQIVIHRDMFSDDAAKAWADEIESGWSSRCGHEHDNIDGLIGHEYGHHIGFKVDALDDAGQRAFWDATAKDLGIDAPATLDAEGFEQWINRFRYQIYSRVSEYATTSEAELLAEVWLEFSTNPKARPAIKAIGERLKGIAEGPAPTPRVVSFSERIGGAATDEAVFAKTPASMLRTQGREFVLSDDEVRAFGQYRGIRYNEVNGLLRGTITKPLDTIPGQMSVRQINVNMASAFKRSELRDDVVVWRGSGSRQLFGDRFNEDLTGFEWKEKAYTSTSASQRQAEIFAPKQGSGVLMRILAPKGTRGVQLSGTDAEWELLLDKGYRFRVVEDRGVNPVTGLRLLDVEVVL